jgi:hypothetical protein
MADNNGNDDNARVKQTQDTRGKFEPTPNRVGSSLGDVKFGPGTDSSKGAGLSDVVDDNMPGTGNQVREDSPSRDGSSRR